MQDKQGAGFYSFAVGNYKLATLSDGFIVFDHPKPLFAGEEADDAEYESTLSRHFLPPKSEYSQLDSIFIDTGKNKVLIDVGAGTNLGPTTGNLVTNLGNLGVGSEEIDTVFLSHGHMDHLGGSTNQDGNPLFPNARYLIGQKEWDFWMQPIVPVSQPYPEDIKRAIVDVAKRQLNGIRDRIEFVKPGQEIVTGITAEEAYGHSEGMMALNVSSGDESLFYTADTFMHFAMSLEHPTWPIGFDNDRAQGVRTRLKVLGRVTAEKSLIFVPHFPFPGLGHISKVGESYRWEPIAWRW